MFKKRVGITQRIMAHPRYDEIMGCLDINWTKFMVSLEILPVPLPILSASLVENQWKTLQLDGLILSGGNTLLKYADLIDESASLSSARDAYENALLKSALETRTPILGVCRGLQLINNYYGGKLIKTKGHVGTKHRLVIKDMVPKYKFPTEVNSFHNFAVSQDNLGAELIPLAYDEEDNIEAFYHPKDRVLGIMWHPEREDPPVDYDSKIIEEHFVL